MKIALIGYMGSGKSTLGPKLASEFNLKYYDLDAEMEKHTGYTITETIFNKGELYFRKIEREVLINLLQNDNFVLSTGGGTPCYYDNIDLLNKASLTVYLRYGVNALFDRLSGNTAERPLLAHLEGDALKEYIGKHLFERSTYYDKAIVTIKAESLETEQIINEIKPYIHE